VWKAAEALLATGIDEKLPSGVRFGPYEIVDLLGQGGMGTVYRASDTRLDRIVAIKLLRRELTGRGDSRQRFRREAQAISALNHPHVCSLYDIGDQDGIDYLVMEYVEGETLTARLSKGRLSIDRTLRYGKQIAEALAAAHTKGIVHRDLKPANIMTTPTGVKVLDFGLAKFAERTPIPETMTTSRAVVGTPAYMAPEQLEGRTCDARTDIYALGLVLREMASGERSPVTALRPAVLDRVVRTCLAADPADRWQSAHDVKLALDAVEEAPDLPTQPRSSKLAWNRWPLVLAAVMTAVALAVSVVLLRERKEQPRQFKLNVLSPEKSPLNDQFGIPAVSPDGLRLAFVATTDGKEEIWVRDLDSLDARALPGTAGAEYPFWSPDSRAIAFFADGKLKRTDINGGPVLTLCNTGLGRGGTWSQKGFLVWAGFGTGTFRVPAGGGHPAALTIPDKATGVRDHRFPWFLPDGRHFLYTDSSSDVEESGVYVADTESEHRQRLIATDSNAAYSPPGYLLFVRDGALMAQPFDAAKLRLTGDAVPLVDHVDAQATRAQNQFSISQNGVLAYTSGRSGGGSRLTWFDRSGKVTGTLGGPNALSWGAISPDGKTVAVQRLHQGLKDIWLHDLNRGTESRFTFGPGTHSYPAWSADGRYVSFSGWQGIGRRATSGTAQDEIVSGRLGEPPSATAVEDWSHDGRYAVFRVVNPRTLFDIWTLPLNEGNPGTAKPAPYLLTEFREGYARLSPDGRWLAYTSNESKRNEIYVQSFPTPGSKFKVSMEGGERSVWSRDGKELYFVSPDERMMAAPVKTGPRFEAGVPKALFKVRLSRAMDPWFDVTKDGRFLAPVQVDQTMNVPIIVVVNWQAGLKK
jgi:Tol biopolymer transport system component